MWLQTKNWLDKLVLQKRVLPYSQVQSNFEFASSSDCQGFSLAIKTNVYQKKNSKGQELHSMPQQLSSVHLAHPQIQSLAV